MKTKFKRSHFAMPFFLLNVIFVVIPLIILLINAFKGDDGGFTFSNFVKFFTVANLKTLGRSLIIALLTTILSLAICYPLAMILANSKINKTAILVMMFIVPMWINSLLRAYAMVAIFEMLKVNNSYLKVVLAFTYDFFPFMLLPIYTILSNMDKSLIEASTDLGSSSLKTFAKVQLPLSMPGVISGILMVFMPTLSTFSISNIVANSADMYLFGNLIDDYFTNFFYNVGSAYSFILLLIIGVVMLFANKFSNNSPQIKGGSVI